MNRYAEFSQILNVIQTEAAQFARSPYIVAISGFGGSGKSTLAAALNKALGDSDVVSIDSFATPKIFLRSEDWEGFDYPRFSGEVLEPAGRNESVTYGVYDWETGAVNGATSVALRRFLVVEGCGILQPSLAGFYNLSIWVDVPLEEATRRGIARDRSQGAFWDENWLQIWEPNERDFYAKYAPDRLARLLYRPS